MKADMDILIIGFFIYSVLGYISEVIYCSIGQRKLVNRGFLYGPYCPIYGFGALVVIIFLEPLKEYWYLVFILGLILTSIIEYVTSYLLEKIFSLKLWDYSKRKVNINGRVCLRNSLLFGIMGMAGVYLLDPVFLPFLRSLDDNLKHVLASIIELVMVIDATASVIHLKSFQKSIVILKKKADEVTRETRDEIRETLSGEFDRMKEFYSRNASHFLFANPGLTSRSKEYKEAIEAYKAYIEKRKQIKTDYKRKMKENREDFLSKV
ncbi:MAG TPA: putative ABC transporter permease [Candidatus Ornithospirochaeta avicola]|uniref:ABC transporter permease n=1 Tax=Candidatus Ornithospirochaeta avicola TaxID=2840896 RepID=A0A9D1TMW4_9SPIO|nr:putative ABC transporter permease [Candidatus Ornithospirochaeta avicola]